MKANNSVIFTAVLIGALCLISCSKPETAIIGKWQEANGGEKVEFFKDGTVSIVTGGMTINGKYAFIDDTRIKIEAGGLLAIGGPVIVNVKVSRNDLTLSDPSGKVKKYQKAD